MWALQKEPLIFQDAAFSPMSLHFPARRDRSTTWCSCPAHGDGCRVSRRRRRSDSGGQGHPQGVWQPSERLAPGCLRSRNPTQPPGQGAPLAGRLLRGVPVDHSWAAGSSVPVPGPAHFGPPSTRHPWAGSGSAPRSAAVPCSEAPTADPCPGTQSSRGWGELGVRGQGQALAENGFLGPQGATDGGSWAREPFPGVWPL